MKFGGSVWINLRFGWGFIRSFIFRNCSVVNVLVVGDSGGCCLYMERLGGEGFFFFGCIDFWVFLNFERIKEDLVRY